MSLAILVAHAYSGKFALDISSSTLSIFLWIQVTLTTLTIYLSHFSRWLRLLLFHIRRHHLILTLLHLVSNDAAERAKSHQRSNDKGIFRRSYKIQGVVQYQKEKFHGCALPDETGWSAWHQDHVAIGASRFFSCHYYGRFCP